MADKTLRVPADSEPAFWNKDVVLGAAIGTLLPVVGPITPIAGGVIGGFVGQNRMRDETEKGKDVKPPTFWNRTVVNGAALGSIIGVIIGVAVMLGTFFFAGHAMLPDPSGSAATFASNLHAAFSGSMLGMIAVPAGSIGGAIIGGVIGGNRGKSRMEKEYKDAQEYVAQHGEYQGNAQQVALSQGIAPQRVYTVTPEEAQALQNKLAQSQGTNVDRLQQVQPGVVQI